MTEETLKKAIKIKNCIDRLREIKRELENGNELCWGNTSEVSARRFEVQITEGGCYKKTVKVSSQAAKKALDYEIAKVYESLEKHLNELSELN